MRIVVSLILLLMASDAYAQQCGECTLADACIREYSRATAEIKAENKRGIKDWQKGMRDTGLSENASNNLSQRGTVTLQKNLETLVRLEIEKLKECLGKIR